MTYNPDDDGGYNDAFWDEARFTCCGGLECHRLGCWYDDDLDAIASVDDPEDEEPIDEADELFTC